MGLVLDIESVIYGSGLLRVAHVGLCFFIVSVPQAVSVLQSTHSEIVVPCCGSTTTLLSARTRRSIGSAKSRPLFHNESRVKCILCRISLRC